MGQSQYGVVRTDGKERMTGSTKQGHFSGLREAHGDVEDNSL